MGFGHRVYKNYDPRAQVVKEHCDRLMQRTQKSDPLLEIAKRLEERALEDSYFRDRKLFPNIDFYTGSDLSGSRNPHGHVHRDVLSWSPSGLDCALAGDAPIGRSSYRSTKAGMRGHRRKGMSR